MRVRMLVEITGTRNGQDWPAPGEILECGDAEAAKLIANKHATGDLSEGAPAQPQAAAPTAQDDAGSESEAGPDAQPKRAARRK